MGFSLASLVGLVAAASTIAAFVPRLFGADARLLLKEVHLLLVGGFSLWIVCGVMTRTGAVVAFGVTGLALTAGSVVLKFRAFVREWW